MGRTGPRPSPTRRFDLGVHQATISVVASPAVAAQIEYAKAEATAIPTNGIATVHALVEELIERGELSGTEIDAIISHQIALRISRRYGKRPRSDLDSSSRLLRAGRTQPIAYIRRRLNLPRPPEQQLPSRAAWRLSLGCFLKSFSFFR